MNVDHEDELRIQAPPGAASASESRLQLDGTGLMPEAQERKQRTTHTQTLSESLKEKIKNRFAMCTLKESDPGNPLLLHDEPIYYDGKIIGETTSGNYSFLYNKNIAYGYIKSDINIESSKSLFEIEVAFYCNI